MSTRAASTVLACSSRLGLSRNGPAPRLGALRQLATQAALPSASGSRSFSSSAVSHRNTPARRPRDPLETAPNATRHALPTGETFIVRPPPSAPTPFNLTSSQKATVHPTSPDSPLPPALRPNTKSRLHETKTLSAADIARLQELRKQDPMVNTASRLAKQFGCSPTFVSIVAPLERSVRAAKEQPIEFKRANWGANKTLQRELRKERKSLW